MLYDAVAIIASEAGAALLAKDAAAKDFVTDAFAHCKFVGYTEPVLQLFEATGLAGDLDDGCFLLPANASGFIAALAELRFWDREHKVDLDSPAPPRVRTRPR